MNEVQQAAESLFGCHGIHIAFQEIIVATVVISEQAAGMVFSHGNHQISDAPDDELMRIGSIALLPAYICLI